MQCAVTTLQRKSTVTARTLADNTISLQVSNAINEYWIDNLPFIELKVLRFIYKKTFGFKKTVDSIAISQFCDALQKCKRSIIYATQSLAAKGLIIKYQSKWTGREPRPINRYEINIDEVLRPERQRSECKYGFEEDVSHREKLSFGMPIMPFQNKSKNVQFPAQHNRNYLIAMPLQALPIGKGQGFAFEKRAEKATIEPHRPKKEPDKPDSVQPGPTKIVPEPKVVKEESPLRERTRQNQENKTQGNTSRGSHSADEVRSNSQAQSRNEERPRNTTPESPHNEAKRCEQYKRSPIAPNRVRQTKRSPEVESTFKWLKTLELTKDDEVLSVLAQTEKREDLEAIHYHLSVKIEDGLKCGSKIAMFRHLLKNEGNPITPQSRSNQLLCRKMQEHFKWRSLEIREDYAFDTCLPDKQVRFHSSEEIFTDSMRNLYETIQRISHAYKPQEGERLPSYYEDDYD